MRINNIESKLPTVIGGEPDGLTIAICKWEPNSWYGKRQQLLDEGFLDHGDYIANGGRSISNSMFELDEFNYVVAFVDWNEDEDCTELRVVGERLLELSKEERKDFFKVYKDTVKKFKKHGKVQI